MKPQTNLTTLSFSEAGKILGTGKDNIARLVNEGEIGFVAFDKVKKNKRIPIIELERYLKNNIYYKAV